MTFAVLPAAQSSVAVVQPRVVGVAPASRSGFLAGGLPGIHVVGLDRSAQARDRVRAALQNAQFEVPTRKVTVNLARGPVGGNSQHGEFACAVPALQAPVVMVRFATLSSQNWRCAFRPGLSPNNQALDGTLPGGIHDAPPRTDFTRTTASAARNAIATRRRTLA
jgi:hypothetical protein